MQTSSEPSLTSIVSGIVGDFQELIKQQLALFKAELTSDFRKTRDASLVLVSGVVALLFGSGLLCLMLVHLLDYAFAPHLPLWSCYLIVGGAVFALGAGLTAWGWKQFQSFHPLQSESVDAMKENLEWKTTPTRT